MASVCCFLALQPLYTQGNSCDKTKDKSIFKEKINETESRIIALIRSDAHITQKKLSEAIGLTRQYIGRRMDSLQTRNIIRRVGPAKGGHWEVVG